jgi:hypothetical protein
MQIDRIKYRNMLLADHPSHIVPILWLNVSQHDLIVQPTPQIEHRQTEGS